MNSTGTQMRPSQPSFSLLKMYSVTLANMIFRKKLLPILIIIFCVNLFGFYYMHSASYHREVKTIVSNSVQVKKQQKEATFSQRVVATSTSTTKVASLVTTTTTKTKTTTKNSLAAVAANSKKEKNGTNQIFGMGIYMSETTQQRKLFKFQLLPWRVEEVINQTKPCKKFGRGTIPWAMVFVVKSAVKNQERRATIRATWGSVTVFNNAMFQVTFVLGESNDTVLMDEVSKENELYGDILLYNKEDKAEYVPEKVIAGMQWAAELPPKWMYASIDDDIMINHLNLVDFYTQLVAKYSAPPNYYIRYSEIPMVCVYSYQPKDIPDRKPDSKWYMPEKDYPGKYWPIYCRGGMYTTSSSMVKRLFEVSRRTLRLYLDDVWITGFMRLKLGEGDSNIRAAPGSQMTDLQLTKDVNLYKVISLHYWGNIANKEVNVTLRITNDWKLFKPTIGNRIRCYTNSD